jgi:hypothetical protein
MRIFMLSTVVIIGAVLAAGCASRVRYDPTVSGRAYGPELVYVGPGVQVIADYDEPIFFADNVYWKFDGRTWYRSSDYTGGWVYAPPPPVIRRIERPHEYVHYRPAGWVARRDQAQPSPVGRGHRDDRPADEPRRIEPSRPSPPPAEPRAVPPPAGAPPTRAAPPSRAVQPPQGSPPTRRGPHDHHEHR